MASNPKEGERNITRRRASRTHQGPGHWHVEKRSTVIVRTDFSAQLQLNTLQINQLEGNSND